MGKLGRRLWARLRQWWARVAKVAYVNYFRDVVNKLESNSPKDVADEEIVRAYMHLLDDNQYNKIKKRKNFNTKGRHIKTFIEFFYFVDIYFTSFDGHPKVFCNF